VSFIELIHHPDVRRVADVDGHYGNMTRQQLQLFSDELRCQVSSDVIIIIIITTSLQGR